MPRGTVSVRWDETTLERLSAISKATGRSRGALMSHAIERYAEFEVWHVEAIQTAMDQLASGEADLVEHTEVADWLDTWGTADDPDRPE